MTKQEKLSAIDMKKVFYKVVISGRFCKDKTFPSLNDMIGKHWTNESKLKRDCMMIASNAIRRSLKRWKPKGIITLHYVFYEPKKGQIRDHMNVFGAADKIFQDALQKCGVIQDDSPKYVDGNRITHRFNYTDKEPYIVIGIEELGIY